MHFYKPWEITCLGAPCGEGWRCSESKAVSKPAEKAVHCATSAPRGSSKHQSKSMQMLRIRHRPKFTYLHHRRAKRLKLMCANLVSYVLQSAISWNFLSNITPIKQRTYRKVCEISYTFWDAHRQTRHLLAPLPATF